MAITLTDNEFFTGLTNLALFMRLYATNTSRKPDSFIDSFATETLANGNTKIFPYAAMPSVGDYNETSSLLTVTKVTTGEETLSISEKKVIKSSYSSYILTMAFTSDSGMNGFIGYLLGQMESSKTDHLYDVIIGDLFSKTFTGTNQNQTVNYLTETGVTSPADINAIQTLNSKSMTLAIQKNLENMQVYNTGYNKLAMKQALDLKDLKMVICQPYQNEQTMNLFATLLNSEYIKQSFDKPTMLTIPEIKIAENMRSVIGWVMHKFAYQYFYKFTFMGTFFDASNLVVNNFLHFWYGKGWLDNLPVCKFTAAVAGD